MMRLWFMSALIALMSVSAYPREAEALSGKKLLEFCEAEDLNPTCVEYIVGISAADGFLTWGFSDDEFLAGFLPSIPICIPSKTVFGSMLYLQTVVINYLHAHLDDLHLDAAELTQTAFIEAFPCTSGP